MDATTQPSFQWPPEPAAPAAPEPAPSSPTKTPPLTELIDSIELDLLGRASLSFDRWASRSGWEPDTTSDYCWRCAGSVGPHEQDGEGCAACRAIKLPWDRAFRLGVYRDRLRDETLALKFQAWRPGGRALGRLLGGCIAARLKEAQIPASQVRLVPIPMHPLRRIRRGIDHTEVLARGAAESSNCPIGRVLRARRRPEQVGLSATDRAKNVRGSFRVSPHRLKRSCDSGEAGVRVWVLIDDVRTTGATFTAGAKALRQGLKTVFEATKRGEIWICSVGVTGSRDRRQQP
ncbi:MAG: ComF family protein [Phycisphaerales bacterium]